MQARKELTLSVLEDVSRGILTSGCPTRRLEVLKAPRRIYVAFGEHPAAGVCVCVCSSKLDYSGLVVLLLRFFVCVNVCGGVCSFVCLFADSCFPLFLWLVVGVYVCLCVFRHLAAHFRVLFALWETFLCFSCTLGGPATPG